MIGDGAKTYGFDFGNRLTSASGGVALVYDPTSRHACIEQQCRLAA